METENIGYANVRCQIGLPGCLKKGAGYSRYKEFARIGPLLDACEACARKEYKAPPQFQKENDHEPKAMAS